MSPESPASPVTPVGPIRPAGRVLRFAPSPTGYLHIGNARTALYNALLARRGGGRFILRLDDTDRERSREEYAEAIRADLDWLGIPPDVTVRQSDRIARYDAVAADLKARGLLYPCYESAEELEYKRRRQRSRGLPPVYDRGALALGDADRARLEAGGRRPHWRFRLPVDPSAPAAAATVGWDDLCRGSQTVRLATLSDPVLIREDGSYLYTLTSIVDDLALGVTDVVRGDDHVTNTGVQIAIIEALGAAPPRFGHHNLLVLAGGEALSKRSGAMSLKALRADGFEPLAVAALAVLIGTALPVEPVASLDELAARLDLAAVSRSPARFDPAELAHLNAAIVHGLPFAAVAGRLAALGVGGGSPFWDAVRDNIGRVDEAAGWWRLIGTEGSSPAPAPAPVDEDEAAFLALAAELLPPEPWDETTFAAWTAALKTAAGRSGRSLFMPLRRALTGEDKGPEMARLLPLMGRRTVSDRLRRVTIV